LVTVGELLRLGLGLRAAELAILPERDEAVQRLSVIGSFDLDDLRSRCWRRTDRGLAVLRREVPEDWVVRDRRRLAPGRLAQAGTDACISILWQLRAFPCDPDSGEMLIERCECGEPFWWAEAETLWDCVKCGRDARQLTSRSAPPDLVAEARELAQFFRNSERPVLPKPFHGLSDFSLFSAMNWLGYFSNLELWLRPGPANALTGYRCMKDWPSSFDESLKSVDRKDRRDVLISKLILCIKRAKDPDAERIFRKRASEFLGVPDYATEDDGGAVATNHDLRNGYITADGLYLPASVISSEWAIKMRRKNFTDPTRSQRASGRSK
jgi:hypothetical protein